MTECEYPKGISTFEEHQEPEKWSTVPVMAKGAAALEELSKEKGLGYDEQDIAYYLRVFRDELKRDPTTVECFDLAQGNSEHSRHWFFGGKVVIDGEDMPLTLFQWVKRPLKENIGNSVIGFHDNSSALRGYSHTNFYPSGSVAEPGPLKEVTRDYDITLTVETHNFPCGIAPFPGAETGAGGRIRDGESTGKGSLGAATAGLGLVKLSSVGGSAAAVPHDLLVDASALALQPLKLSGIVGSIGTLVPTAKAAMTSASIFSSFGAPLDVPLRTFAAGSVLLSFPTTWFTDSIARYWNACAEEDQPARGGIFAEIVASGLAFVWLAWGTHLLSITQTAPQTAPFLHANARSDLEASEALRAVHAGLEKAGSALLIWFTLAFGTTLNMSRLLVELLLAVRSEQTVAPRELHQACNPFFSGRWTIFHALQVHAATKHDDAAVLCGRKLLDAQQGFPRTFAVAALLLMVCAFREQRSTGAMRLQKSQDVAGALVTWMTDHVDELQSEEPDFQMLMDRTCFKHGRNLFQQECFGILETFRDGVLLCPVLSCIGEQEVERLARFWNSFIQCSATWSCLTFAIAALLVSTVLTLMGTQQK
ncbi:putative phosphoribosylformylglycinamidine synthase, chloroplastic/mitochondrial [Symbiodinium microadriaticum]|uniref:Putative phosphoribosylformylglycinamidine synthase, chloroplastic/mitochondrial n=1 Tax=Symbiodinium microadriaticum TaxID=2951 RepID=A0A1Q9DX11_SYMMI|nr:putative phosphoribosylformylglycinamidine synthase, chloroplastic/mitochondrial [Symbiodinium microadriaticum]